MNTRSQAISTPLILIFLLFALQPLASAQPSCLTNLETSEVNGTVFHYIECGQGEPVIFVHGTLGDYRSWISQVGPFSEEYRVISYSRRYHYPNPWPKNTSDFSATIHAKDLVAFIQSLNLGKVHLVGHSYGALTSLLVARDNPNLFVV
ncbi:alpha/beta fold hydrolase [Aliifodinibius sp. S!AR15-10]|uniref:alpha/beta fold hydrolase n=1 Tax=Aliifodinibius sp. S!AR15-10 TaxID=2950437 RepID=UPI0038F5E909